MKAYIPLLLFFFVAVASAQPTKETSSLHLLQRDDVFTRDVYPLAFPIPKVPARVTKVTHTVKGKVTKVQEFKDTIEVFTKEIEGSKVSLRAFVLDARHEVVKAYDVAGKKALVYTYTATKPQEVQATVVYYKLKRRQRKSLLKMDYADFVKEAWHSSKYKPYQTRRIVMNAQGRKTYEVTFNAQGDTVDTDVYAYEADGAPMGSILSYPQGNTFTSIFVYQPARGTTPKRLQEFTWEKKNKAGKTLNTHVMKVMYNDNGLVQTDIYRDGNREPIYYQCDAQGRMTLEDQPTRRTTDRYTYTYDNLIRKVDKQKDGRNFVELYEYEVKK